jgi:hypothetical protein
VSESIRLNNEDRIKCEVWNRVMGYHRPVSAWNTGKQQEHRDRKLFREDRAPLSFRDEWPHSRPPGINFSTFKKRPSRT